VPVLERPISTRSTGVDDAGKRSPPGEITCCIVRVPTEPLPTAEANAAHLASPVGPVAEGTDSVDRPNADQSTGSDPSMLWARSILPGSISTAKFS
jgi:hypothetical protein